MKINYNNRKFKPKTTSDNSQTSSATVFRYSQEGEIVSAEYHGGQIRVGHLLGKVDNEGHISMVYHHIDLSGNLNTGRCNSKPVVLSDGRIELHESWEWTSGDLSSGESVIEEIE